jgi:hypothetical protein
MILAERRNDELIRGAEGPSDERNSTPWRVGAEPIARRECASPVASDRSISDSGRGPIQVASSSPSLSRH